MKKWIDRLLILLPAVSAVLNGMPGSVRMKFADQDGPFYAFESGYSMIPVGYANWGHMLAGIASCILVLLAAVRFLRSSEKLNNWMFGLSAAAAGILTVCMLFFSSGTVYSWMMLVFLLAEALLIWRERI